MKPNNLLQTRFIIVKGNPRKNIKQNKLASKTIT